VRVVARLLRVHRLVSRLLPSLVVVVVVVCIMRVVLNIFYIRHFI